MDYNTQRSHLVLPEYGRCIQDMVMYATTIKNREERLRCAYSIIDLMSNMQEYNGNEEDFYQKLWNHLAYISGYQLDIDYPVEIQRIDEQQVKREPIPLPLKKIKERHYGAIIEGLTRKLAEMEPGEERNELTRLVANQMKRAIANWNINALDDEKIMDDLARLTGGKVQLLPSDIDLISDKVIINELNQQGTNNKKKKKK